METTYDSTASYIDSSAINPNPEPIQTNRKKANLELLDDFINFRGEGRTLYNQLFRFIREKLGNYEDAEDTITKVQITAWKKKGLYDPSRRLNSWLFAVAGNQCIDYQRRNQKHNRMARLDRMISYNLDSDNEKDSYCPKNKDMSTLEQMESEETREKVRTQLEELPIILRIPLLLVYFGNYKYREAAEILEIPIGTVKSRMHAGLKQLEKIIRSKNAA